MAGVSFALTETISAPVHAVFEYGCILRWVRATVPLWGEPVFR